MELYPDEFQIKRLKQENILIARQLFLLFNEVFGVTGSAKEPYLKKLLKNPAFICFAAIYKNEVIGGLNAYELPMYYPECSEIYIYDIAIKPEFQRMGFGKMLLSAIKEYAIQNGIKIMFVDADEGDNYALDFYRSVHGSEEKVVQFTFIEKGNHLSDHMH